VKVFGIASVIALLLLAGCKQTLDTASSKPDRPIQTTRNSRVETTAETAPKPRIVTIYTSSGKKVKVPVEIADTEAEREKGLMYRTTLAENRGMLFVYPDEGTLVFWMKNTLIPLSIAFMDSEDRILDIQTMKPVGLEQTVPDAKLPRYVSAKPAQYALEVNRGFFKEHGVKVGDRAKLPE
jgi:uncharacterized membrane protein (UPF0127 family)